MMTPIEIEKALGGLSYMPGFALSIEEDYEGPFLVIEATLPDANDWSLTTDLRIESFIPPMHSVAQFDEWVGWRLARVWVHESWECLRRDGKPVRDPGHDLGR